MHIRDFLDLLPDTQGKIGLANKPFLFFFHGNQLRSVEAFLTNTSGQLLLSGTTKVNNSMFGTCFARSAAGSFFCNRTPFHKPDFFQSSFPLKCPKASSNSSFPAFNQFQEIKLSNTHVEHYHFSTTAELNTGFFPFIANQSSPSETS